MKAKLEYIWLDGYKPTQTMRSKTLVVKDFDGKLDGCPIWSFDGSSTDQAAGNDSDCLLKPVALFPDPVRDKGWLVMTEVLNANGTPHPSNGRATIDERVGEKYGVRINLHPKPVEGGILPSATGTFLLFGWS
ncbi:Glutamine synthetase [subsurface metagenome]